MTTDEPTKIASGRLRRLWDLVLTMSKTIAARVRESLTDLVSLRTFLAMAIGAVLLQLFGLISIPFAPFTTTGKIYVDSPEVYTRERLVNDRYDQDYWLRQRLEKLDKPEDLQLMVGEQLQAVRTGAGEGGAADGSGKAEGDDGPDRSNNARHLSFEQEFRVASGVRDMIRQQILENMLDDRHDLTGNSVFGLKFDTTVIPGSNTRRRAFVHVALTSDDLFRAQDEKSKLLGYHIEGWVASRLEARKDASFRGEVGEIVQKFKKQQQYYLDWLTDVAKRLNRAEDSVYESNRDQCPTEGGREFFDKLTGKTLEIVLGMPVERFWRLNGRHEEEMDAENEIEADTETDTDTDTEAEAKASTEPKDGYLKLPDPWDSFFQIERTRFQLPDEETGGSCRYRVWFEVDELTEIVMFEQSVPSTPASGAIAPLWKSFFSMGATDEVEEAITDEEQTDANGKQADGDGAQAATTGEQTDGDSDQGCYKELFPVGASDDEKWNIQVDLCTFEFRKNMFEDPEVPKYRLSSDVVEKLLEVNKGLCDMRVEEPCNEKKLREVVVQSGFFNFVEHMSARDAYSYAIFPKNDVVGIFTETSAQLSAVAPMTGFLDLVRHLRESETASVLVGYGDGAGRSPDKGDEDAQGDPSIEFGWVISARGDMEPTQKSQLALVSVPAWTDTLDLRVSVGWIDWHGNPERDEDSSFDLRIAVPPSLEVFDFIFREDARFTLGPSIRHNEIDEDVYVRTGMEANILIPGSRLWRSATVTLGAQVARRIRVLPNMEGIIAEFDRIEPPYAAYNVETGSTNDDKAMGKVGTEQPAQSLLSEESKTCLSKIKEIEDRDLLVRAVKLRVWTSEGVAKANRWVCVVYDPDEVLNKTLQAKDAGQPVGQVPNGVEEQGGSRHVASAEQAGRRQRNVSGPPNKPHNGDFICASDSLSVALQPLVCANARLSR